jgi:hypothetical protein
MERPKRLKKGCWHRMMKFFGEKVISGCQNMGFADFP